MTYLTFRDPEAFEGLQKHPPRPDCLNRIHECPKCRGHGGWILKSNAYGEGKHFMAFCGDCEGYGYTSSPVNHPHEWNGGEIIGRCRRRYTCALCGASREVDSSD